MIELAKRVAESYVIKGDVTVTELFNAISGYSFENKCSIITAVVDYVDMFIKSTMFKPIDENIGILISRPKDLSIVAKEFYEAVVQPIGFA